MTIGRNELPVIFSGVILSPVGMSLGRWTAVNMRAQGQWTVKDSPHPPAIEEAFD